MLISNIKEFLKRTYKKKIICLDVGKRNVGIAMSDEKKKISIPLKVVSRSKEFYSELRNVLIDYNISGILGNGLRPDVWKEVQSRFKINHIVEFYGSSEGNINLFNIDSRFGAIGRIPSYLKKLMNIKIIKFDKL